jgi:hypothetical protein
VAVLKEKAPPTRRGKVLTDVGGPSVKDNPARSIVDCWSGLFPDFNPLRSAPATADKPNAPAST